MKRKDPAEIIRQRSELRRAQRPAVNYFARAGIFFTIVFICIFVLGIGILLSLIAGAVGYLLVQQYNQRCIRDRMNSNRLQSIGDDFPDPARRRQRRK